MKGPELVFLHIPKTAGTSQQNALYHHYGTGNVFWVGRDCAPGILRYPRAKVGERFVVGGHKPLSFYPRGLDPLYCALVREPIERAISLFSYYTQPELAALEREQSIRAQMLNSMLAKGIDPDSMLNSIRNCRPFRREISNYQCRYLSRGRATFDAVQKSLRGQDFMIGTVASYDRFHQKLWELLDWAEDAPVQANRSQQHYAAAYLQDEELVSLVSELNEEDRKLVQWVETEQQGLWLQLRDSGRRRSLRNLPIKPGRRRERQWTWQDASNLWPARDTQRLDWPLSRVMVAEPQKLVYVPNPGPADSRLQKFMLEQSSVVQKEAVLALGIGQVVERFVTGLVLEDRTDVEIEALASPSDYFKFAVLYEPVARLVELYRQRFVDLRDQLARWPQLYALVADVQGRAQPDIIQGISFRQFVMAIVSGRHNHRLFQIQSRCLPWPDSYDRIYRADQLQLLERDLARLRGLSLGLANGMPAAAVTPETGDAAYSDTLPGDLPADPEQWRHRLLDEELSRAIKGYYARDYRLYNTITNNEQEVA